MILECYDDLPPIVSTKWQFNSTALNFTGRFAMGEKGELVIFDVRAEDMGRFVCEVGEEVRLFRDLVLQGLEGGRGGGREGGREEGRGGGREGGS